MVRTYAAERLAADQNHIYSLILYSVVGGCFACYFVDSGSSGKNRSRVKIEELVLPGFVFPNPPAADRFVSFSTEVLLLCQLALELLFYPSCAPRPSETRVLDKQLACLRTHPLNDHFIDELIRFLRTERDLSFFSEVIVFHCRCRSHSLFRIHY